MKSYAASMRGAFVSLCLTVAYATPACASDMASITALFQEQKYTEALNGAEHYLARQPRDAQMRFLKGLILAAQERTAEAISVFSGLTQDYPKMPEPYNNLAVLYAAQGSYQDARDALENALRNNPAYEVAHENLGDIYIKLATQAYDRALQLNAGSASAKTRTAMLHSALQLQEAVSDAGIPATLGTSAGVSQRPATVAPPVISPLAIAQQTAENQVDGNQIMLHQQERLITASR